MSDVGWLAAAGLGAVQGVTEFLPVSSSGHLAIFALLSGEGGLPLRSAVLLHASTLAATALVLRRDLATVAREALQDGPGRATAIAIVLGSIPTAILGLTLEPMARWALHSPAAIGVGLLASAIACEATRGRHDGTDLPTVRVALLVGLAQGFAVMPGISRSAATIACGLWAGLSPMAAFRFSFLLSMPAIAGATLLELGSAEEAAVFTAQDGLAAALAFATGAAALLALRVVLARGHLRRFAWYLWPLGVAMIAWGSMG
jgi:undecaprenyl-diphosphatase